MVNPKQKSTLALVVFIATEVMFFAGLLSSYWVLRSQIQPWPPLGQPRYPVELTALNTLILLFSGWALWRAEKSVAGSRQRFLGWILAAVVGGALFLTLQGYEWVRLIGYGMGMVSNVYGGLFYLVVGSHALHVAIGLSVLLFILYRAFRGRYLAGDHQGLSLGRIYWLFVVLLWPVLYVALYLL